MTAMSFFMPGLWETMRRARSMRKSRNTEKLAIDGASFVSQLNITSAPSNLFQFEPRYDTMWEPAVHHSRG